MSPSQLPGSQVSNLLLEHAYTRTISVKYRKILPDSNHYTLNYVQIMQYANKHIDQDIDI